MKNVLLATAVAFAMVGAVSAAEVSVEGQRWDGKDSTSNANSYQLMVKQDFSKNFAGDLSMNQQVNDPSNALTTRLEAGATVQYTFAGVSPYVRGAIGQKYTNTQNFAYYSIEPGVAVPVPNTGATVSLGYRYRDAFSDSATKADQTNTWRAKLAYDLTKVDNVYVGFDYMRGDQKADIIRVGYARTF